MRWPINSTFAVAISAVALLSVLALGTLPVRCEPTPEEFPYLVEFRAYVDISSDDTSKVTISGTFFNPESSRISVKAISIPLGPAELIKLDQSSVSTSEGARVEVLNGPDTTLLVEVLPSPVPPGEKGTFQISYVALSGGYVKPWMPIGSNSTTGGYRMFNFNLYNPNLSLVQGITDTQVTVLLPRDALLTQLSPLMNLFYPNKPVIEANLVTRRTQVSWTNLTVAPGEGRLFIVTYSLLGTPSPPPQSQQNPPGNTTSGQVAPMSVVVLVGSNGLAALTSAALTYLLLRRKLTQPRETPTVKEEAPPKTVLSQLSPEEMKILETVQAAGGSVSQRDIPPMVGFSKSKVSRMLKRLEELGLINRTTLGRTKLIELSETASRLLSSSD
ncbi:MAG: MarR family transcriptional regulator [Candidatus Korarchaeota archaeon]|nr:MarR family transcriptional regulator [Candidatus Korarchaeota archaeon]